MGKRELVALLNLSSWRLVMVEWLFLAVPWGYLRFVIVVFTDHTHLLFLTKQVKYSNFVNNVYYSKNQLTAMCTTRGERRYINIRCQNECEEREISEI